MEFLRTKRRISISFHILHSTSVLFTSVPVQVPIFFSSLYLEFLNLSQNLLFSICTIHIWIHKYHCSNIIKIRNISSFVVASCIWLKWSSVLKLWDVELLKEIFLKSVERTVTNLSLNYISLLIRNQNSGLSTSFYYEKN